MWWQFVILGLVIGFGFGLVQRLIPPVRKPGVMPFLAFVLLIVFGFLSGWINAVAFFVSMVVAGGIGYQWFVVGREMRR